MHYRAVGALAIGATVVIALVGCSNNAPGESGGSGSLTFAAPSGEKPGVDALIEGFEKETGIQVETTLADTDAYITTLSTQLSSGTAPDVFFTFPGDGSPAAMKVVSEAGYVDDLSDMDFVDDIPKGFRDLTDNDGKTYIAPVASAGVGSAFNLTAMEENGWEVPTTWSDTLQLCADARAAGKTAFAFAGATPWNVQLPVYALVPTLVYGPTPDFAERMANGEETFADSAWVDAANQMLEMQEAGCFQESVLGTAYEDALSLVASGEAMASVQVNASLAGILQGAPEGTELDFVPLPATDNPDETRMAAALGASFGVNAKAKNKENALAFVEYATSDEGLNLYNTAVNGVPALPSASFDVPPALTTLVEYLQEGKTSPFPDQLWPNAKISPVMMEQEQRMLADETDAKTGIAQMDVAYADE